MLRFEAYRKGHPTDGVDLAGAYAFGLDDIPVRADIVSDGHLITCMKQFPGAAGLAVVWETGNGCRFLLPTTRLPDRAQPYVLNLELARAQMMRLYRKREDWGMFDHPDAAEHNRDFLGVRALFIEALKEQKRNPEQAAILADEALQQALLLGEKAALLQANHLSRKKPRAPGRSLRYGSAVPRNAAPASCPKDLADGVDFLRIPTRWVDLEPAEKRYQFGPTDAWMNHAARAGTAIHAGPLLSFDRRDLPEWLGIWRTDFAAFRDSALAFVQRTCERYGSQVDVWVVGAGLNAANPMELSFEQILELTRSACRRVKELCPDSGVLFEITCPFGEYYARNQRTIPPLLFADMLNQTEIPFDAFGLAVQMGLGADGYYVRDLLQIASLIDEFLPAGRAVHLSGCGVPSENRRDPRDAWGGAESIARGGMWHNDWSQTLQAEWLQAITRLARSRSRVESLCWADTTDATDHRIPNGGLFDSRNQPKRIWRELQNLRKPSSTGNSHHAATQPPSP